MWGKLSTLIFRLNAIFWIAINPAKMMERSQFKQRRLLLMNRNRKKSRTIFKEIHKAIEQL